MQNIWITVIILSTFSSVFSAEWIKGTTTIEDEQYSYEYLKHQPSTNVLLYSDSKLKQDSAFEALRSLYTQMKLGNWESFQKLNIDFPKQQELRTDLGLSPIPPKRFKAGWKSLNFDQRSVLYTVKYKEHIIFVVADATSKQSPYDTPTFKRIKGQFFATNWDINEDPFCWTLGDWNFDIETGKEKAIIQQLPADDSKIATEE